MAIKEKMWQNKKGNGINSIYAPKNGHFTLGKTIVRNY